MEAMEEFRYLILAIQREGNRLLAATLKPLGVTPSQGEVLRLLATNDGLTLNALGDLLVCETGSSPSRLVDRLVSQELVERRRDETDRRAVRLHLTDSGRLVAADVARAERHLHDALRRSVSHRPVEPALEVLRAVADTFPTGEVLARRRAMSPRRRAASADQRH